MVRNINDEISRCFIILLLQEPFYAHILNSVIRKVTLEVPTAAVGFHEGQIYLYINEDFFLNQLKTDSERVAVIKHETLHVIFKHLFRLKTKSFDRHCFNIAADIVVNQFIGPWTLPESAITLSSFTSLKLPPDKSVEWYYHRLIDRTSDDSELNKQIQDVSSQRTHGDHSNWIDKEEFSIEVAENQIDNLIISARDRIHSKDFGTVPLCVQTIVSTIFQNYNSKIDWKRALKIFASSSKRSRVFHTMKRVSKRYGTRPGLKIKRYQNLVVAIDTSGSIDQSSINIFFNEIHRIWKFGADIEIFECDSKIQNIYSYSGRTPEIVSGGGGTSFDPVFNQIMSNRYKRYDGCIYLTDGCAQAPVIKPPCKVFWCITKDGNVGPHLKFGRVVQMN